MTIGLRFLHIILLFTAFSAISCEDEIVTVVNSELIRHIPGRPEGLINEVVTLKIKTHKNGVELKQVNTWYSAVTLSSPTTLKKGEELTVKITSSYPADSSIKDSPAGPGGFSASIGSGTNLKALPSVEGCADCTNFEKETIRAQLILLVDGKELVIDLKKYDKEDEVAMP